MTMWRRGIGLAIVAVLATAGCFSEGSDLTEADIERYMQASAENSALRWQVDYSVKRIALLCMEQAGFDAVGEGYEETFVPSEPMFQDKRSRRASRGLSITPDPEAGYMVEFRSWELESNGRDISGFDRLPESERNRWYEAWFGPYMDGPESSTVVTLDNGQTATWPKYGCQGEAYTALFGEDGYASYIQEAIHAQGGLTEGWESEEEVVQARYDWTVCMAEAGYEGDFESPDELRRTMDAVVSEAVESAIDSPQVSDYEAAELAMAETDIACQDQTDVVDIEFDVYSRQLVEILYEHEEQVFAFAETAEELLVRAQEILESGQIPS
ncbi:hypothetical protein [Glycomyces arizonensis]|uniref:hypothetical protein n=1 Tax=Glycomyces arizonensis TaxID=256035 RepID=UPI0012EC6AC2|nr:hypothetical protein [Glycomyces arizonensis]